MVASTSPSLPAILNPAADPLRVQRIVQTKDDPYQFGRVYFPEYHKVESPAFHHELFDILTQKNPDEWYYTNAQGRRVKKTGVVIAAPRGHAKSTLVSLFFTIWSAVTQRHRFIMVLSASATLADGPSICGAIILSILCCHVSGSILSL